MLIQTSICLVLILCIIVGGGSSLCCYSLRDKNHSKNNSNSKHIAIFFFSIFVQSFTYYCLLSGCQKDINL